MVRRGVNFSRSDSRNPLVAALPQGPSAATSAPTAAVAAAIAGTAFSTASSPANGTFGPFASTALGADGVNRVLGNSGNNGNVVGGENGTMATPISSLSLSHMRRSSRSFRHQSVEDELWGWFGDDRPLSDAGAGSTGGGSSHLDLSHRTSLGPHRSYSGVGGVGRGLGGEDGGGGSGGVCETEVTVSTLALTERLAKLSAGRALLDQVRAESQALVVIVSSATRRGFGGGEEDSGEDYGLDEAADNLGRRGGGGGGRIVTIAEPPVTEVQRDGALASLSSSVAGAVEEQAGNMVGIGAEESLPLSALPPILTTITESSLSISSDRPSGNSGGVGGNGRAADMTDAQGHEDEANMAVEAGKRVGDGEGVVEVAVEVGIGGEELQQQQQLCTVRQAVVEAKADIQALQREIRKIAREGGEDARDRVGPLVAQREMMAKQALPGARKMARRLQEIAETQQVWRQRR